jgi:hypothetical protein
VDPALRLTLCAVSERGVSGLIGPASDTRFPRLADGEQVPDPREKYLGIPQIRCCHMEDDPVGGHQPG